MKPLTISDFYQAALLLNCEVAAIRAVHYVEAAGSGFFNSGKIKIRFEAHWFSHYTNGLFDKLYPNISVAEANSKLSLAGENEYRRFSKAFALSPKAAMLATSWGAFQIMGFNFEACGFDTVDEMVNDFKKGEDRQLIGFSNFIKYKSLDDELRNHQWATFAKFYNGRNFAQNQYDKKLLNAYNNFKPS